MENRVNMEVMAMLTAWLMLSLWRTNGAVLGTDYHRRVRICWNAVLK